MQVDVLDTQEIPNKLAAFESDLQVVILQMELAEAYALLDKLNPKWREL